ncbi:Clavaminate synthase-like protein [Hygrophoropsis aurantiaca]|uniref:Clavaminate synthase-like protein n=1 Tax=Hygrophoropsis aurantiaca TaxID=72124 RepID=A0ACB8AL99_9AGAM|nr:Clavaminate synthase-like protein [Hygrophoropsis aurantiaca]
MMNAPTSKTFEDIPVIDFVNATSNDPVLRRALADEIRDACVNVGFFYIMNHGIPENTIDTTIGAAKQFFALPTQSKAKLDIHKSPNFKGYTALLGENANPENRGDLHEGFDLGYEANVPLDDIVLRDDGNMTGANVWPDELPTFRKDMLDYYHAAIQLGRSLFSLFALALNLPENFFDDKITKPAAIMRLLYYPPQPPRSDEGVIGIGAHTDYECFTILWQQQDIQALQVMNANGKWIDAVSIPGTLVLNLGDQFARWTNDVFKSTVHRAINQSGTERYSIPLFFGTDYDVKLEPIPGCTSPENPFKYEVVTAGEYVKSRLEATYAHSKETM